MSAEPATARDEATGIQRLAAALRSSASKLAERAEGGVALVFAATPGDRTPENAARLRAAAGFPLAESAREAAQTLLATVHESISAGIERGLDALPSLGERAAGGMVVVPMRYEDKSHGALVVGAPTPIGPELREVIVNEATALALRLDNEHLRAELDEAQAKLAERETGGGESANEEILSLSEALFAQDIELLRSREKLGKIERLKNDFIEKMSRELRTPLNSIIEAIISVLTGENEILSENSKGCLRAALDDGTEFLRTLQNILDLWRIKQRELPVEIQDVNFREVVDEAIFSIQDRINDKPVVVEPLLDDPFPKIRTDVAKINQILYLLLENAVKFTPRGRVVIRAKLVDGQLECSVEDTGIGICHDDQPYIFDEFFQVDELSGTTFSGAGLGLALVRDLALLMEGDISVSSDVGQGTIMTFRIPVLVAG